MKRDNKKALYESIMTSVSKEVKKALNENSIDNYSDDNYSDDNYSDNILLQILDELKRINIALGYIRKR